MPGSKGPQEGVLHHVVRVGFVAGQREGKTIDVVDPREGLAFERHVTLARCAMSI